MKQWCRFSATTKVPSMVVLLLLVCGLVNASPNYKVDQAVQYLIAHVAASGQTFFRNGKAYTPSDAAEHMNKKYQHFSDEIKNAEDFIALCATRSLLTGKPYLVADGKGGQQKTADWLRALLADYRVANP